MVLVTTQNFRLNIAWQLNYFLITTAKCAKCFLYKSDTEKLDDVLPHVCVQI